MVSIESVTGVAIIALGIVLSPGPNMAYLVSRTLAQGRMAGLISLAGVGVGLLLYMLAAALGLGALFELVPQAFVVIKTCGALYLGYLAWQMVRSEGTSFGDVSESPAYSRRKLFGMGLFTNLLNPKVALMYAALIPPFIEQNHAFEQFIALGSVQITIALTFNALIVCTAAKFRSVVRQNPTAMNWQRWISGSVLGFFAVKMLLQKRPSH